MGCSSLRKSCKDKSCQRYYNISAQPFAADETIQLAIAGARVVDSGVAIETEPMSYNITKTGLYHISADVIVDVTTLGSAVFNAYLDGVPLPCMTRAIRLPVGYNEIHAETDLSFSHCCPCINKTITFTITSEDAVGTVTQFCTGVLKLA